MPRYHTKYTRNSLDYTQIERHEDICLFEGVAQSGRKEYEIHILRHKPAHPKSSDAGQMMLSSPSTSEWGIHGFTYLAKEKAHGKLLSLAARADQNADSSNSVAA